MKKREGTRKQEIKGWSEKREDGSCQVSGKTKRWNEGISFDSISLSYLSNGMIIHTLLLHLLPSFLPSSSLLHSSEPNQRFLTFSWIEKGKKENKRKRRKENERKRRKSIETEKTNHQIKDLSKNQRKKRTSLSCSCHFLSLFLLSTFLLKLLPLLRLSTKMTQKRRKTNGLSLFSLSLVLVF